MTADGTPRDAFAPGDTITDAGRGYPWTKNVDGTWWRVGQREPLTWEQVLAWHQAAIDNPDDETTEPFRPVLMVSADGTYSAPRAGETITTAAELDALPDATVVLDHDGDAWQSDEGLWSCARASLVDWGTAKLAKLAPLTVLFRPDAPQPATVPDDAVERAAREYPYEHVGYSQPVPDGCSCDECYGTLIKREAYSAGLAAARAGEAEHVGPEHGPVVDGWGSPDGCTCQYQQHDPRCISLTDSEFNDHCDCRTLRTLDAAQRGGEAVDRDAPSVGDMRARHAAGWLAMGRPEGPEIDEQFDAFLAARGDAAPTVITDRQELDACRAADQSHGLTMGAGEPWRYVYLAALGIEVR